MKVLLASAELAPLARVGGMAEAVAGLVKQLRHDGVAVTVVVPDYDSTQIPADAVALDVPDWAGPVAARPISVDGLGAVTLITAPLLGRSHPYNDESGLAFPDNDLRFFAFSAGVAALAEKLRPDVVHLNDWHTAATLGLLTDPPPSVLTIHTLAYQGIAGPRWMDHLVTRPELFAWYGDTNPLLGGIRLADRVVTVSPNYARDVMTEPHGMGLHHHLAELGPRLIGIINGIDAEEWNPETDAHLAATYSAADPSPKARNQKALVDEVRLGTSGGADGADLAGQPLIGMVSRLVEQKGIDLVVDAARFLEHLPGRLVVLGSGEAHHVRALHELASRSPYRIAFVNGYDAPLSHRIFAGADLLLMPSRFEPCGLTQMQAMRYGTLPVVTDVGGLRDTVVDLDDDPERGLGWRAPVADSGALLHTLRRAVLGWGDPELRLAAQRRGMTADWSWREPAAQHVELYRRLVDR